MEEEIGRYRLAGDDGGLYEVVEFQELLGREQVPGMRRLELLDGREVIRLNNRLTIRGSQIHLSDIP